MVSEELVDLSQIKDDPFEWLTPSPASKNESMVWLSNGWNECQSPTYIKSMKLANNSETTKWKTSRYLSGKDALAETSANERLFWGADEPVDVTQTNPFEIKAAPSCEYSASTTAISVDPRRFRSDFVRNFVKSLRK